MPSDKTKQVTLAVYNGSPVTYMINYNCNDGFAIAQSEVNAHLQQQADQVAPEPKRLITQRKAKLNDKNRTRRRDVQQWVFRRTGLTTTKQVKHYLKKLGHEGDGRLTSFWVNVNLNYADEVAQLVKSEALLPLSAIADSSFKVGNRVNLLEYPPRFAHLESMAPFVIGAIADGKAALDFCNFYVDLGNLQLVS